VSAEMLPKMFSQFLATTLDQFQLHITMLYTNFQTSIKHVVLSNKKALIHTSSSKTTYDCQRTGDSQSCSIFREHNSYSNT